MTHIRSRKHSHPAQPRLNPSILALAVLSAPVAAHAQTSAAGTETLPEVTVTSTADVPYKAETVSTPKLPAPLVDTPKTVSVIRKEIIQEQGATTIMDALRNTPGITMQLGENGNTAAGDTFQMRGFSTQSSMFLDGVRDLGAVTRDTFNVEQVEVVKGASGTEAGRGAASGYVNLVTKLPSLENSNAASAAVGSGDFKRATADLNRTLSDTSAMRLNLMVQDSGVPGRDVVENTGFGIAPSLAFGLGTPTRVYLYSQHVRQDNVPDGGIPTIGLKGYYNADAALRGGARVDSHNFYGSVHDYEKVDADMVTARIEHDLGSGLKLQNITRYGKSSMDRVLTGVNAITAVDPADPASWEVARLRQRVDQENEIIANQTNLTAEFKTGSVEHTLTSGLELLSEKQSNVSYSATGVPAANLYNPNPDVVLPALTPTGGYTDGRTRTVALYAADYLKLSERWQVNGGVRLERYSTDTDGITITSARSHPDLPVGTVLPFDLSKSGNLVSWNVGAVYKPAHNGSIYASYANAETPPGSDSFALSASSNADNPALDPSKATTIEIGTKWDLLQKKLAVTAALYRIDSENELVQVDDVTNEFSQFGKRRVQGFELGVVGQLSSAWQVSAGLATMDTKVLEGSTGNNSAGAATRWSPDLTATLWSTYKLSENLTFGGGVRYVSDQKRVVDPAADPSTQNMPVIPSYWVADAMVSYKLAKNASIQLNINNLFDKFYIARLNNSGARYFLGTPRSALLTANFVF